MNETFDTQGVARAFKFRKDFSENFRAAGDEPSFLISVPAFDAFLLSLPDYPIRDIAGAPFIPAKDSPAYPKHVHFRNGVRRSINRFSVIGAHIREISEDYPNGEGHPPFRIDVAYEHRGRYTRGKNAGEKKPRKIDKQHYRVQLKEGLARVLHRETAESMASFIKTKHNYTDKIEEYLQNNLRPGTEAYLRFFAGRYSYSSGITFVTDLVNRMMTDREALYKQLVGEIGDKVPPPVDPNLLPGPDEDEE